MGRNPPILISSVVKVPTTDSLLQHYDYNIITRCSILSIFLRPIFTQIIHTLPHIGKVVSKFQTWKHQHSQICKFETDKQSLSEKSLENFKQQDSIIGLKQQHLGIQRTMSNRAMTEAEANNWNDKISFIFFKYTSNVTAMVSDVNIDII